MTTKNTTTQTAQFNPASLGAFNSFMGQVQPYLSTALSNPLALLNPMYNLFTQQATGNASRAGQTAMSNITGNTAAAGFGGQNLPAFLQSQINAQNRQTSGNVSNAFIGSQLQKLAAAQQLQGGAASSMLGFRPLQTGSTNVEQQSGLGTWLPMVAGGALSAMMPGGLLSGMFKGGGSTGGLPTGMNSLPMGNFGPQFGMLAPRIG